MAESKRPKRSKRSKEHIYYLLLYVELHLGRHVKKLGESSSLPGARRLQYCLACHTQNIWAGSIPLPEIGRGVLGFAFAALNGGKKYY